MTVCKMLLIIYLCFIFYIALSLPEGKYIGWEGKKEMIIIENVVLHEDLFYLRVATEEE